MHTGNFLVVAVDPTSIFEKSNEAYIIKAFGSLKVHLGCDCAQFNNGATTQYVMGSTTYIMEFLRKVCALLKVTTLWKQNLP